MKNLEHNWHPTSSPRPVKRGRLILINWLVALGSVSSVGMVGYTLWQVYQL